MPDQKLTVDQAYKEIFGHDPLDDPAPTNPDRPDNAPPTESADAVRTQGPVRRFIKGATDRAIPSLEGVRKMVAHPLDTIGSMAGGDLVQEGRKEFGMGHRLEGFRKMTLGAVPFLGNYLEQAYGDIGEKIGEGDYAGAAGTVGGEVGATALAGGAGETLAKPLSEPLKGLGRHMYQHDMLPNKWFRDLPKAARNSTLDMGLDPGKPWEFVAPTEKGLNKAIDMAGAPSEAIENVAAQNATERVPFDKLDDLYNVEDSRAYKLSPDPRMKRDLSAVQKTGRDIKYDNALPAEIDNAKTAAAFAANARANAAWKWGDPPLVPITEADITPTMVKAINYPSSMSVRDMMDFKREARDVITSAQSGRMIVNTATDAMAKSIGATANEILIERFPELKALGVNARDAINLRKMTQEAVGRSMNRSITGMTGAMGPAALALKGAEAIPVVGKAGAIAATIRNPAFRAGLASAIYKSGKYTGQLGSVAGRLEALAAELDNQEANDQKDADAVNAKP